jgi:hypothetical protein
MIVQFFNRGKGGGSGPIDYLLGKKRDREQAELLRGDPDETAAIIDGSLYAKKYTSGVLSFEEENISTVQKFAIMDSFEECIFAGLDRDQYNCLWVQHQDKGRLELNFVIPNVELLSKKRLQPYFHAADHKRVDAWRTMQNIRHGLSDPDDPARRQNLTHAKDLPKSVQEAQEAITDGLMSLALGGQLKNRADVLKTLENAGFEISRTTATSISIKNPEGGRNIRLKGALYEQDFRFSQDLSAELKTRTERHRATSKARYSRAAEIYQRGIEAKRAENNRRHSRSSNENEQSSIQTLSLELGRIIANSSRTIGHEFLSSEQNSRPESGISSSQSSDRKARPVQQKDTAINVYNEKQTGRTVRSNTAQFPTMGQKWGIPSHTATTQQIREPEDDRNRSYIARNIEKIRNRFDGYVSRFRERAESRRAEQARDRERNNQRFAELWRKIGEARDKLFNTSRANHEIERNFNAASRSTAAAKQNLNAVSQSLEQSRKVEQRQSMGWSMSR